MAREQISRRNQDIYISSHIFNNVGRDQINIHHVPTHSMGERRLDDPDIELGPFYFEEHEVVAIPNIDIPSDVDVSDGTFSPVQTASQDKVLPINHSEHNTRQPQDNVIVDNLNYRISPSAYPTKSRPKSASGGFHVFDGTTLIAASIPAHSSDVTEDPNTEPEAQAREAHLRQMRIETRTNNAVNWLRQTYGSINGLDKYMKRLDASDIIRRSCEELRELCGMSTRPIYSFIELTN